MYTFYMAIATTYNQNMEENLMKWILQSINLIFKAFRTNNNKCELCESGHFQPLILQFFFSFDQYIYTFAMLWYRLYFFHVCEIHPKFDTNCIVIR